VQHQQADSGKTDLHDKTNKRSLRLFYVLRKVNGDVGYTIVAPGLKGLISLSGTASLAVKVSALARSSAART
jgi:hypothetical protein